MQYARQIKWKFTAAVLVFLLIEVNLFYSLGGPTDFKKGQKIDVEVAKIFSLRTQLSYEYYSLPFCLPKNGTLSYKSENLGEMLRGGIIVNTPYEVGMAQNIPCKLLCDKPTEPMTWKESNSSLVYERIQQNSIVHLNKFRVVGSIVEALSVDYNQVGYNGSTCNIPPQASPQYVNPNGTKILFFYSVEWEEIPRISWSSRWNIYVTKDNIKMRWLNINCLTYILFLFSGITTFLLYIQVKEDIARCNNYTSIAKLEEALEITGWNFVYADVFRPPTKSLLFAAVIGSGIQVFVTIFILVLVAGYFSGRLYKTMQGEKWKKAAFLTATLYPGIALGTYLLFNFFSWEKHNSGAVLFSTMISLLRIWFGISLPLVYVGYFFGYCKNMAAGVLPFSIVFLDLFCIVTALWQNYLYVVSEFSFIVFIYLVISCSGISIIMVYFQLRNKDHRWWWRCFMYSGSSAAYILAFSIYYFFTETNITEIVPTLMYFVYMSLIAITFWLLTGTISFFAAFIFIRKIITAIKSA
ncbi:unnamed protein product [Trichogramma brassicae]|uniref:Transmembrane 9 superfamily member n=1 Tax=Trichogramma brassicae TaxID=86971 RepID=A0A6H5IPY3_9HYME|nr:unnamed protein product [Trichogramma brassicae]